MKGWIACSWDEPELRFIHLRRWVPASKHLYRSYAPWLRPVFHGTSLLFMLASAVYRLNEKPYVLGSLAILWGCSEVRCRESQDITIWNSVAFFGNIKCVHFWLARRKRLTKSIYRMNVLPDFNRKIYCILGLPFDALSMSEAVQHIRDAAASRSPCFLSTPNLNFLIGCQSDISFRDSVINSDLSVADGMPSYG